MYVNTDDPSLRTRIIEELEQVKALDIFVGAIRRSVPKNRGERSVGTFSGRDGCAMDADALRVASFKW